jgi:hypothetical protein
MTSRAFVSTCLPNRTSEVGCERAAWTIENLNAVFPIERDRGKEFLHGAFGLGHDGGRGEQEARE